MSANAQRAYATRSHGVRREPHTHYCGAGEHIVDHGSEPCSAPLCRGYECEDCARTMRDEELRRAR